MIIWGLKTKKVGDRTISGTCPTCNDKNLMLVGYVRVFDIFFIPVFPYKKLTYVECGTCSSIYHPEICGHFFSTETKSFKMPWWSFSGLLIIGAIEIAGNISQLVSKYWP